MTQEHDRTTLDWSVHTDRGELSPGWTATSEQVHLVDFESESLIVRHSEEWGDDQLLCGPVVDAKPASDPPPGEKWCHQCIEIADSRKYAVPGAGSSD